MMPDLDILYTSAARGWYRPARLTRGNASAEEVADSVVTCLAAELRNGNGLPRMAELCDVLSSAAGRGLELHTAFERLRQIERVGAGSWHLRLACHAAGGLQIGW
jgi:hypothetical protein